MVRAAVRIESMTLESVRTTSDGEAVPEAIVEEAAGGGGGPTSYPVPETRHSNSLFFFWLDVLLLPLDDEVPLMLVAANNFRRVSISPLFSTVLPDDDDDDNKFLPFQMILTVLAFNVRQISVENSCTVNVGEMLVTCKQRD